MRFACLIFFVLCSPLFSLVVRSQVQFSGTIKSKETGEAIPRASVGILGTQNGTIANAEGRFRLALEKGKPYRLRIRAIGYKPDTISISLDTSAEKNISLATQAVTGKEIIVSSDASRVEARRIMHEVIRRKQEWQSKLKDYTCSAYSRWNLKTGSSSKMTVQSVLESTADCFWKKDKGFSETITSRKQTANFSPDLNIFSVGEIVNFYDNRLEFNDFSLVGPVADDAFDSYDYDLTGTEQLNGASIYQISVEPGLFTEGFEGTLWIDQTDYTIAFLDLSPSKAVKLGPLKEVHLQQTFELFENQYYLPIDLRTSLAVKFQMPFIPEIKFELFSVLQNYSVNKGLNDTLFGKERHRIAPNADSIKQSSWASNRLVPLALDEEQAYQRIDSVVEEAKKDSAGGFNWLELLTIIDMPRNDAVEGWRFGLSKKITPVRSFPLTVGAGIAYGLDDKQWKYFGEFKQGLIWDEEKKTQVSSDLNGARITTQTVSEPIVRLAVEGRYFYDLSTMRTAYTSVETSVASLLNFNSNMGYYYEKGFFGALDATPGGGTVGVLWYRRTQLWESSRQFLADSSTAKQNLGSIGISVDQGIDWKTLPALFSARYEISSAGIGSDFTYSMIQLKLSLTKKIGAFGTSELIGRYSTLFAGQIPAWHMFFFETRDGIFSKPTYFRGLDPFEFQGDRLASINLEHDFYDLPTRPFGISFIDKLDLHWLLHAGIGIIELDKGANFPVATTSNKPYVEIGPGIGNILNILQIEGTWRLTHKRTDKSNFYPTISLGFSF